MRRLTLNRTFGFRASSWECEARSRKAIVLRAADIQNPRTYSLYTHMKCNIRNSLYEQCGEYRIRCVHVVHSACTLRWPEQRTLALEMSCLSETITSETTAIKACTEMHAIVSCFQKTRRSEQCNGRMAVSGAKG
jgi:hypothetical protein